MFEKNNILYDAKTKYKNIVIPDKIDDYVKSGIEKGKVSKKSTFHKKFTTTAACLVLITFVTFIRVSPTFAAYLSNVPILQYFVELINYDKGLKSAVENDFVQHIGKSDEHDGIIFTVDDVIIDEERMIISYTTKNKNDDEFFSVYLADVTDDKNNGISALIGAGDSERDEKHPSKSHGIITLDFGEDTSIPNIFVIKPTLIKSENGDYTSDKMINDSKSGKSTVLEDFKVSFTVDKTKFENLKKSYEINKTVEIEGQKIIFENASISPTRITVKVTFDSSNTKQIFSFKDLEIIDEQGTVYGTVLNGAVASYTDEFHRKLYFESNYFDNPGHLYLKGSSMSALDKDKLHVKVDLENKKLLTSPDDNLILEEVRKGTDKIRLAFQYNINDELASNHQHFNFHSKFQDIAENSYHSNNISIRMYNDEDKDIQYTREIVFKIPSNENYQNPIILTISDYPTKITRDFIIKIK
jgi:uncharacterized protein DUF5643/uncharacterized protein DUF4179